MKTRITIWVIFVLISLVLAGCSTPTATPTEPVVEAEQPTQMPSSAETPTTEAESSETALAEGQTCYQIIAAESEVKYEVGETFINQDNRFAVAVGVTTQVTGEILIDRTNPQNSSIGAITVDISKFTSDSSRRDNVIRNDWLESARFPLAVFTPTSIEGLPSEGVEGQSYDLVINGDLKVKESTRPVTFTATVSLSEDKLSGVAQTTILMSDFGVGPISIAGILNTEDEVRIIFNIVARP
jgi:polyisoprenoid-binding protein YceI